MGANRKRYWGMILAHSREKGKSIGVSLKQPRRDEGSVKMNLNTLPINSLVRPSESSSLEIHIHEIKIVDEVGEVKLTILIWG